MTTIRTWMPLGVGLALLVGLGLFGFSLTASAHESAADALRETAVSREQTLATLAQQYHGLTAKEALDFAEAHEFELTPGSEADTAALEVLLERRATSASHGAVLADLQGRPLTVVAHDPGVPPPDDPGYSPLRAGLARGGPGISSVMDVEGVPVVAVGVPVLADDTPVAVLLAYSRADTSHLQAYSEQLGRAGGDVAPMVLDSTGTVAAAHDADLVGGPAPASPAVGPDAPPTGFAEFERDGVDLVVAHAREPDSGWTLLREEDAAAFWAPVANQSQTAQQVLLGALLAGAIVAVVLNHRTARARRRGEQRSHALVEDANDVITVLDPSGTTIYVSPTVERVLGHDPRTLVGARMPDLVHPDDVDHVRASIAAAHEPDHRERVQARVLRADGACATCELVVSNQHDNPAIRGTIVSMRDVSELVDLHDRLAHQARHDPLTQLPNRMQLEDRLTAVLAGSREADEVAVLFADLDGFKPVNDRFGHSCGDQLLVEVAARLQATVRGQDLVARLGGDEFVIVVHGRDARGNATRVADRVLDAMREPVRVDGEPVHVGVSMGIAVAGPDDEPGRLLRAADQAMYRAKDRGRNAYEFADAEMAGSPVGRAGAG